MLEVGYIARAHGLAGEVIVELVTDRTERLAPGTILHTDEGPLEVLRARPHGGPNRFAVFFDGIADRSAAEARRATVLRAEPLGDTGDGTLWVHELVGCAVTDTTGTARGRVTDVQANPASDLLVLEGGALVPLRFVVEHGPGEVVVDVPDGLFDL